MNDPLLRPNLGSIFVKKTKHFVYTYYILQNQDKLNFRLNIGLKLDESNVYQIIEIGKKILDNRPI